MNTRKTTAAAAAIIASALLTGCVYGLRAAYAPTYYNTSQCYWTWENDGYGGYEQMYCYNPYYSSYRPYYYGNTVVRRYPGWYSGPQVRVVVPPVQLVRPPAGAVFVPPPPRPPMAMPVR